MLILVLPLANSPIYFYPDAIGAYFVYIALFPIWNFHQIFDFSLELTSPRKWN